MFNVLACIHPLTNHQNTNTYSLSTMRNTEFTQAVITPVAHGEYGTNRVSVIVYVCVVGIVCLFMCGCMIWSYSL